MIPTMVALIEDNDVVRVAWLGTALGYPKLEGDWRPVHLDELKEGQQPGPISWTIAKDHVAGARGTPLPPPPDPLTALAALVVANTKVTVEEVAAAIGVDVDQIKAAVDAIG